MKPAKANAHIDRAMTFSPTMHKQIMAGAKSVTRRLNNTYRVGQIVAAVTHWHTNPWDDTIKPVDLDPEEPFKWFWMPNRISVSGGKLRQARFFPRHMYHLAPLRRIVDIWKERLQAITEADALLEGFTPDVCAEVFKQASNGIEAQDVYWIEDENGNETTFESVCLTCAEDEIKKAKKLGKKWRIRGGSGNDESDGPAFCDRCGVALSMSLTEYGVGRELRLEDDPDGSQPQYFPVFGNDAAVAYQIAAGIGDLRDEHHGRLAQIGFATAINLLHKRDIWAENPLVYRVEFEPITNGQAVELFNQKASEK